MKQKILLNGRITIVDTEAFYSYSPVVEDHVEITTVDVIIKTGEGDNDFIVGKKVIETKRCNNREYIESFADMVGIKNIIKKALIPGNEALLNQVNGQYIDVPFIPSDTASQKAAIAAGQTAAAAAGVTYDQAGLQAMIDAAVKNAFDSSKGGNE